MSPDSTHEHDDFDNSSPSHPVPNLNQTTYIGVPEFPGAPWAYRQAHALGTHLVLPSWGLGDVAISLVGAMGLGLAVALAMISRHIDIENGWGLIASFVTPWILLAGWPVYCTIKKGNGPRIDLGLNSKRAHLRLGLLAGVASLVIGGITATLTQHFTGPLSSNAGNAATNQHGIVLVVFCLFALFGAPIVEELAFRGLLFGALSKAHLNQWLVLLISSALFSLYHFEPKRLAILFAIGLVVGEVRRRTGSTTAAMVTHFVNNAPGVLALLFAPVIHHFH